MCDTRIVKVVGLKHYRFNEPKEFGKVFLVKEPENEYDPKAIAVYNRRDEKMGYVTKEDNANEELFDEMMKKRAQATILIFEHTYMIIEVEGFK